MNLLTLQNAKTIKGEKRGYLTGILYLIPADGSGLGDLCPFASAGCREVCLNTAGRGVFSSVQDGRLRKTRLFFDSSARFVDMLLEDVHALKRIAAKRGMTPCVRLNGTSDIPWERIKGTNGFTVMAMFPDVTFYDYTKRPNRTALPDNYTLTFSRSECNDAQAREELKNGRNVAVVFDTPRGAPLPKSWNSYPVVDGDLSDLRFLDPTPVVVGLRAKGKARKDTSGFVWPSSELSV